MRIRFLSLFFVILFPLNTTMTMNIWVWSFINTSLYLVRYTIRIGMAMYLLSFFMYFREFDVIFAFFGHFFHASGDRTCVRLERHRVTIKLSSKINLIECLSHCSAACVVFKNCVNVVKWRYMNLLLRSSVHFSIFPTLFVGFFVDAAAAKKTANVNRMLILVNLTKSNRITGNWSKQCKNNTELKGCVSKTLWTGSFITANLTIQRNPKNLPKTKLIQNNSKLNEKATKQ